MNTTALIFSALLFSPLLSAADIPWTYSVEEGEDATSSHYYFYQLRDESIERIRWVWNGGAQNAPTVTEYILGSGKITVRHLVGKRESIPELTSGKEAELALKEEYSISSAGPSGMLVLPAPGKEPSSSQRVDLVNLINLLATNRKPVPTKADEAAPSDGSKPARE